jgi:hypothetical protein
MVSWTSLAEVEEMRSSGKSVVFAPASVLVVNFIAPNPYPRRFMYLSCPYRHKSGKLCAKSLERGPKCDHSLQPVPAYRFHICISDAAHSGGAPMSIQMWDVASILLHTSPSKFSMLSEVNQLLYLIEITQNFPKVKVWLSVSDFETKLHHLEFTEGRPHVPLPTPASPLTPASKSSRHDSKKVSSRSHGKPSTLSAIQALEDLVQTLKYQDLSD